MKRESTILERNLERCCGMRTCPCGRRPRSRRRLVRVLDDLPQARAPHATQPHAKRPRRNVWPIAAALAASVLALLFARQLFVGAGEAPDVTRLLADGRVCVRAEGGTWRAASAREEAQGIDLETSTLGVATPATSAARVWLASAGKLELAPDTQLAITRAAQLANQPRGTGPGAGGNRARTRRVDARALRRRPRAGRSRPPTRASSSNAVCWSSTASATSSRAPRATACARCCAQVPHRRAWDPSAARWRSVRRPPSVTACSSRAKRFPRRNPPSVRVCRRRRKRRARRVRPRHALRRSACTARSRTHRPRSRPRIVRRKRA